MKDFCREKIYLLLLLAGLSISVHAQNGNPLQFLRNVSQSMRINPATQNNTEKLVVGLPAISGTAINWTANFGPEYMNFAKLSEFYHSLNEPADAFTTAEVPLLFLSLGKETKTFSFSISDKLVSTSSFDHEILNFLAQGTLPYYGNNLDFGPVSFYAQYYREIAVAYSSEIRKGVRIGMRPKLLFNKFYYNFEDVNFTLKTLPEEEILQLIPKGKYTIAGPVKVEYQEKNDRISTTTDIKPGDYFLKPKNMGAAIDLGIVYNISEQTELSLSLSDLGITSIKNKAYEIGFTEALDYSKYRLYQSTDSLSAAYRDPLNALSAFGDSVPYITTIQAIARSRIEPLPVKLNVAMKYRFPNNLGIGFSNHLTYYQNRTENYFSGFIHAQIGNKLEAVGTLSLYKLEKIMPGIGFSYTGNWIQYFLSTNNIMDLVRPTSAKNLNLCFGVNFLFSTG